MTIESVEKSTPFVTRRRRASPITIWAALGVVFLLIQTWILGQWIAGGGLHAVPSGGYDISPVRAAVTWVAQAVVVIVILATGAMIVRGCRRARIVTVDAALFVGCFFTFWQDPLVNYDRLLVVTNRYALNVTTWGPYIPGWHGPHPELQVQTVIAGNILAYLLIFWWLWIPWWLISRVAQLRPQWGMVRLLLASLLIGVLVDLILEIPWVNSGMYAYSTAPRPLSVFGGHWYQVSIVQILVFLCFLSLPVVMMRLYAQKRGTTVHIFQGSEPLGATRLSNGLRLLAGIGLVNVVTLITVIAMIFIGHSGDPIPVDMPSYLWPR
jgi:hypothetical protein